MRQICEGSNCDDNPWRKYVLQDPLPPVMPIVNACFRNAYCEMPLVFSRQGNGGCYCFSLPGSSQPMFSYAHPEGKADRNQNRRYPFALSISLLSAVLQTD